MRTLPDQELLEQFFELDYEIKISGQKTSDGDGRTAEDIRRELKEAKDGTRG